MPNVRVYFWELKTLLPRETCSVIISENKALENILCQTIPQEFCCWFLGGFGYLITLFRGGLLCELTFFVGSRLCTSNMWFWCSLHIVSHCWTMLHLTIIYISVLLPFPLLFLVHLFFFIRFLTKQFSAVILGLNIATLLCLEDN